MLYSTKRLTKNIFLGHLWQLFFTRGKYSFDIISINIFFGHYLGISFESLLNKRFARTKNIQKLFWIVTSGSLAKTYFNSSCHDGYVMMFIHILRL